MVTRRERRDDHATHAEELRSVQGDFLGEKRDFVLEVRGILG